MENNLYLFKEVVGDETSPFIKNNILSFGVCKPQIRKRCKVGDYIISTISKTLDRDNEYNIFSVFKVDEKLTYKEYFQKYKKRLDCIYHFDKNNNIYQIKNEIHDSSCINRDLSGEYVLISYNYWFFGKNSLEIPDNLQDIRIKQQGYKSTSIKSYFNIFLNFLNQYKQGIYGKPYFTRFSKKSSCN